MLGGQGTELGSGPTRAMRTGPRLGCRGRRRPKLLWFQQNTAQDKASSMLSHGTVWLKG